MTDNKTIRTTKQQAWVDAMLTGVTPTEAARMAKYKGDHKQHGYENTTKPYLMQEIERRKAEIGAEVKLEATAILNRLMLISGIKQPSEGDKVLSSTSGDQTRALDLLGKHLKLWDRQGEDVTDQEAELTEAKKQEVDEYLAWKRERDRKMGMKLA